MGYLLNGVETGGLPFHLVKPILDKYNVPFFVETGTAGGDSAREASKMFTHVWTIELIDGKQEVEDAPDNVEFLVGDSVQLLPEIISEINANEKGQYVLFYLDAHYSDIVPNETGYPECPVLEEIKAVAEYGDGAIIIIDDARLFFGNPPYPHDAREWPSICEIFILLKEKFPYHHVTITDDYVLCIPLHVRDVIDQEWRDRFHIRYPSAEDKLRGQVKDVYKAFMEKVHNPFMEYIK